MEGVFGVTVASVPTEKAQPARRKRQRRQVVEGVFGVTVASVPSAGKSFADEEAVGSFRPTHSAYGGERDEVISHVESATRAAPGVVWRCVARAMLCAAAFGTLLTRRARLHRGAIARMLLTRGALLMAATAAAVQRGHVPSHQQQYNVPVRPPTVQVWSLQRYPYLQDGFLSDLRYGERMVQESFYQFPAALDSGEFRTINDMLHEFFKASAFGDRGVKFAYWYEHGTISAARQCRLRTTSFSGGS